MLKRIAHFHSFGINGNAKTVDIGLAILRIMTGLALATVFEKFMPRDGIWGPQQWFIDDVEAMGFPLPLVFAWAAVCAEFFGGIAMMAGIGTRSAALLNVIVTFTAAFVYHEGAVAESALTATVFLTMTLTILFAGPGRFSLDGLLLKRNEHTTI